MQIRKKCDRSVSTSDDEAFFSNEEIVDYEEQFRVTPVITDMFTIYSAATTKLTIAAALR